MATPIKRTIDVFILLKSGSEPYIGFQEMKDEHVEILGSIIDRVASAVESNKADIIQGVKYEKSNDTITDAVVFVKIDNYSDLETMKSWCLKVIDGKLIPAGWKIISEDKTTDYFEIRYQKLI